MKVVSVFTESFKLISAEDWLLRSRTMEVD